MLGAAVPAAVRRADGAPSGHGRALAPDGTRLDGQRWILERAHAPECLSGGSRAAEDQCLVAAEEAAAGATGGAAMAEEAAAGATGAGAAAEEAATGATGTGAAAEEAAAGATGGAAAAEEEMAGPTGGAAAEEPVTGTGSTGGAEEQGLRFRGSGIAQLLHNHNPKYN